MLAEVPEFEPVQTEGQLVKELLSGYQKRGRPVSNVSVLSDEDGNGFGYIGQPLWMRMKNQFEGNLSPKPNYMQASEAVVATYEETQQQILHLVALFVFLFVCLFVCLSVTLKRCTIRTLLPTYNIHTTIC